MNRRALLAFSLLLLSLPCANAQPHLKEGASFVSARKHLVKDGWSPVDLNSKGQSSDIGSQEKLLIKKGIREVESCSIDAGSLCNLYYEKGGSCLKVSTRGERLPDMQVIAWGEVAECPLLHKGQQFLRARKYLIRSGWTPIPTMSSTPSAEEMYIMAAGIDEVESCTYAGRQVCVFNYKKADRCLSIATLYEELKNLVVDSWDSTCLETRSNGRPKNSSQDSAVEAGEVQVIGRYGSIKWINPKDPTAQGYAVDLYESSGKVFGAFTYAARYSSKDLTTAQLVEVQLDKQRKRITFKVKTSCCFESGGTLGKAVRPSREIFTFDGTLTDALLVGTLEQRDGYSPNSPGVKRALRLRRLSDHDVPTSYDGYFQHLPTAGW